MQRHWDEQAWQRRAALLNRLRQENAEHARVGRDAAVLEIANELIRGRGETHGHHRAGRVLAFPRKVRMTERAQIEIERSAREPAQAAAWRKQGGREPLDQRRAASTAGTPNG